MIKEGAAGIEQAASVAYRLEIIGTERLMDDAEVLVKKGPVFSILHNICCHHIYYSQQFDYTEPPGPP